MTIEQMQARLQEAKARQKKYEVGEAAYIALQNYIEACERQIKVANFWNDKSKHI